MSDPSGRKMDANLNLNDEYAADDHINTVATVQSYATVTTFPDSLAATSTPSEIPNVQPPINWMLLPDGRLIDGKNTLQSFDAPPFTYDRAQNHQAAVTAVTTTKQSSTKNLPWNTANVETDRINTTGSTATQSTVAVVVVPPPELTPTNARIPHTNINRDGDIPNMEIHADAVAVVDADISESRIGWPRSTGTTSWRTTLLAMLCVGIIAGIGGYCGAGKCSSNKNNNTSTIRDETSSSYDGSSNNTTNAVTSNRPVPSSPVQSPPVVPKLPLSNMTIVPTHQPSRRFTKVPTVAPTETPTFVPTERPIRDPTETPTSVSFTTQDPTLSLSVTDVPVRQPPNSGTAPTQQITTACQFINYDNVTECQSITSCDRTATSETSIPTEIGLLTQLTFLRLFQNQLSGTIPSTMGNLTQLTTLNLFDNSLVGTIPSELGNLIELTELSLNFNILRGSIPSTFGNLMQMKSLYIYNNEQLSGTVPSLLCSLPEIKIGIDCENVNIACDCCSEGFTGPPCAST